MSQNGQDSSAMLDLYLDGMLSENDLLAFEARLESDPELRAQLEAQETIDASLRKCFAPPAAPRITVAEERPKERRLPLILRLRRSPWLALAATILLAISVWRIWVYYHPSLPQTPYQQRNWQTMEMAYLWQVNHGLVPDWKCENKQQFASAFWNTFGTAMMYDELPKGAEIAGLSYDNVLSPRTMLILTRVEGEPVIVFVDTTSNPRALALSGAHGLTIHSKQVGPLTLYEVSKLGKARLLEEFHPYQMPQAWIDEAGKFKFEPKNR